MVERELRWVPAFRLVAGRFPHLALFERVADPVDWELLIALESLTDPGLRQESGAISLVPPEDRVSNPGAPVIMAPFTHLNPEGSRFADAQSGALYAANTLETAITETKHHREHFLRATLEPPTEIELSCYLLDIVGSFHDLRDAPKQNTDLRYADVMSPTSYVASRALVRKLRAAGSNGICYLSVRRAGGECLAVFRPRLVSHARPTRQLRFIWNGERIASIYELRLLDA